MSACTDQSCPRRRHKSASRLLRWTIAGLASLGTHALLLLFLMASNFFSGFSPASLSPKESRPVSIRRFSASTWERNRQIRNDAPKDQRLSILDDSPPAKKKEKPEPLPEGKVVDVAPGNGVAPEQSTDFLAEKNNRVEKQTRSRHATPFYKNAMPRPSSSLKPRDGKGDAPLKTEKEVIAGNEKKDNKPPKNNLPELQGGAIELPRQEKREQLTLQFDPQGTLRNQIAQDEIRGNSNRLRIGKGDRRVPSSSGKAGNGGLISLTPSAEVLDRISGAPANDVTPMDGIELGEGTFLNTREFKHATFFNRVKQNVGMHWDPNTILRRRDPTGDIYLYKDRYTVVSVILGKDGALKSVNIDHSCGVDFLDNEAMAAFQRAQPFPNPPSALQDEQGEVHFRFGFYFEAQRTFP